MQRFNLKTLLLFGSIMVLFVACGNESIKKGLKEIHWDRDMCSRCQMVVSERKFAVQINNPQTKQTHVFDDLGCALVWANDEKITWLDTANIWINDAKSGEWIDARKAHYAVGTLTPMGYGLSAYSLETFPKDATALNFEQAQKIIADIDAEHKRKRALRAAQKGE